MLPVASFAQLASLMDAEEIEKLRDKKDKISSRLYSRLLETMLADEANTVNRCAFCSRLFTSAQREWEACPRAPPLLDFHGNAIAEHVPNRAWDVNRWIGSLRRSKGGAREAYWRLWGLTHFATCSACETAFPICELDRCSYHPSEPIFDRGDQRGHYPCCGQQALRFDPNAGRRGCLFRRHTPVTRLPGAAKVVETALAHADLVLSNHDPDPAAGGSESKSKSAAAGDEDADDSAWDGDHMLKVLNGVHGGGGSGGGEGNTTHKAKSTDGKKARPHSAAAATRLKAAAKKAAANSREQKAAAAAAAPTLVADDAADSDAGGGSDSDISYSDVSSSHSLSDSDSDSDKEGRSASATPAKGGAGRGGGGAPNARRGWQLESMMLEDERAMGTMSTALERLRREAPPPNQPPAMLNAKPFFLDRRLIMHVARQGGTGVVWPRTPAAAARRY